MQEIDNVTRRLFNIINQLNVKVAELGQQPDGAKQVREYVQILKAYCVELTDLNDDVMSEPLAQLEV